MKILYNKMVVRKIRPRVVYPGTKKVNINATLRGRRAIRRRRAGMAKLVKKVLSRTAETKFVSAKYDTTHNSSITNGDITALCPLITQGNDDFQRLGDKITGKYLIVRGKVQWDSTYLTSNGQTFMPPVTCRVLILSQRNVGNNGQIPGSIQDQYLLKDNVGIGTGRAYTGAAWDNLAPINRELFKVHMDKKIKLNWVHPWDSGSPQYSTGTAGNDRTKYFYCRIPVKKVLRFDSSMPTPNAPDNFAPFFAFGAVNDDGDTPYTTGTPFHVSWLSTLYYTDY